MEQFERIVIKIRYIILGIIIGIMPFLWYFSAYEDSYRHFGNVGSAEGFGAFFSTIFIVIPLLIVSVIFILIRTKSKLFLYSTFLSFAVGIIFVAASSDKMIDKIEERNKNIYECINSQDLVQLRKILLTHNVNNMHEDFLIYAIDKGNIEIIKELVENNAIIFKADFIDTNLFEKYSEKDRKYILNNIFDRNGDNILLEIIENIYTNKNSIDDLKTIINLGADVNVSNLKNGETALIRVCSGIKAPNDLNIVKILVENGANIKQKDRLGHTALIATANSGNTKIVKYLLKRGGDLEDTDIKDLSIFSYALINEKKELYNFILTKNINFKRIDKSRRNYLFYAFAANDLEVIKKLLKWKLDLQAKDFQNKSILLHYIELERHSGKIGFENIEYLVNMGFDVNEKNEKGETILRIIKNTDEKGVEYNKIITFLIEKGAVE